LSQRPFAGQVTTDARIMEGGFQFRIDLRRDHDAGFDGGAACRHTFDAGCAQWSLRYAISIPGSEIWAAHREAKQALMDHVNRGLQCGFDRDVLTIGFTRRAMAYKRGTLVFHDVERLRRLVKEVGPIQFVLSSSAMDECHATLYDKLARKVLPCFYKDREGFIEMMRPAIVINGAFFNTRRMVGQYLRNAYRLAGQPSNGA
jgi:glucan phosphorylase